MNSTRNINITLGLVILLIVLFFADLYIGSTKINLLQGLSDILEDRDSPDSAILWQLRLPKVITALLSGASLSVAGAIMQAIFRNPLAGPYVLGISSGASLGVAILTMLASAIGISTYVLGNWSLAMFSILGAALVMSVIVSVSRKINDPTTLLIIGVLFGSIASAIINLLQSISNPDSLKLFINWTLGSLDTVNWNQLGIVIPCTLICLIVACIQCKSLDAVLLGEDQAETLGISPKRTRNVCIVLTCLLAGMTTAFTGPIGFIGIAVPHLVRSLYKTSRHIHVIPGSILCGSSLLIACDIVSHLPSNGYILPLNAICAVIGAPIVTLIILKGRKR